MAWELKSDRPIYAQIYDKILIRIVCGVYRAGTRLPSVRDLAAEANVNPNTMQRAFTELEYSGLIITQRNSGRVVTEDMQMIDAARRQMALNRIDSFFNGMKELGFTDGEIMTLINSAMQQKLPEGGKNVE